MPDPAGHLLPWALCRPDDVRTYLDRDIGADRESLLVSLINQFSVLAEKITERTFAIRQYTELYSGPRKRLVVKAIPIDSTKPIEVKDGTTVLSRGVDYVVDYEAGTIRRLGDLEFTEGQDNISVLYTGGIVTESSQGGGDDVPWDLKGAAAMQVAWWFKNRSELGSSQITLSGAGAVRVDSPAQLLRPVRETLERYRRFTL